MKKIDDYCYKGTDVLINKLNITNEERLKYIDDYCLFDMKQVIDKK